MFVTKRDGSQEELDIKKIQKVTIPSCEGLEYVSSSELEVDAHIKFIDGMNTSDIAKSLIATAVEKIDIDRPDWTFVASRLYLYDLYHVVGKNLGTGKGEPYGNFAKYIEVGKHYGKLIPSLDNGYDVEDLNKYIKPERDLLFNYLGIKTCYDKYLIKNDKRSPIELPQYMFMAIAMFIAQNEVSPENLDYESSLEYYDYIEQEEYELAKIHVRTYWAKKYYDVISKFEVMLATPTLSNARTNRHQLSSCYIGSTPDNIEGIFDGYKEMGLLSKFGGNSATLHSNM